MRRQMVNVENQYRMAASVLSRKSKNIRHFPGRIYRLLLQWPQKPLSYVQIKIISRIGIGLDVENKRGCIQIRIGRRDYETDRMRRTAPQLASFVPEVQLETRPWFNESLTSRWYFVPGVIGNLMLIMVMMLTAFAVVREREIGTLEQVMVTPIRRWEFILGKTLPFSSSAPSIPP